MNMMSVFVFVLRSSFLIIIVTRWVVAPLWLIVDSYGHIARSLRQVEAVKAKKN